MFRLTREVRFVLTDEMPDPQNRPANSFAGHPPLSRIAPWLTLRITLAGPLQPHSGYLRNIRDIDAAVRDHAIGLIRDHVASPHRAGDFHLAAVIFDRLKNQWPPATLESVELCLSPFLSLSALASEYPMVRLSQKFEFSASHRLHNPALSESENRDCFGKCNNPHGHGHNYELQVTLVGKPDANGNLIDIPAFERIVADTVIEPFDHRNLNLEIPAFKELIPTVENIALVIHRLLKPHFEQHNAKLASVTVWETPKTWCEYAEIL